MSHPVMIENFLRPARTPSAWVADAVRLCGVVSILVAVVWFQPTDAGILAFALPALVAPRFIGVRPALDIASGVTVLVAAWSNVVDLYRVVPAWDIPMHFACTAVLAMLAYLVAAGVDIVPLPGGAGFRARVGVVVTTAFGLALSAVWEMVEWVGKAFVDSIHVTYDDTIGDMVVGGVGSLVAGILIARVRLTAEHRPDARGAAPVVTPSR
ncbi:hypothetical protein [Microbacterium sp. cf332]|uniref:hypothetical protein n=1 Tax=Microbacterium sp. cf332 TaxID=1761804 RepID=UPI000883580B|nr:hypothetical protein [Microbacterium sp. cf332]SDQ23032.1 hypothetical protein SAMN04487847_0985 [Microbacterium sp. cf332]